MRRGEGIGNAAFGEDDDGAMDRSSLPHDVGVPQQRATLARDGEVVRVVLAGLDRTLRYIGWAVSPARRELPNPVPANKKSESVRRRGSGKHFVEQTTPLGERGRRRKVSRYGLLKRCATQLKREVHVRRLVK